MYKQVFKLGFRKSYEYRTNFYMGFVSLIFPLTIQYFMWAGLFRASEDGTVFQYSFAQMLEYAVFASLVTKIISSSFVYEISNDIMQGGLSKYLVKPISYFSYHLMNYMGEKSATVLSSLFIIVAFWAGFALWGGSALPMMQLLLFLLSLTLGMFLNFIIFYGVCSMGFWMINAGGAIFVITLVGTIVSGGIFPLDIFGSEIQFMLHLLPFPYTSYFPISILCGTISGKQIAEGLMLQMFWIGLTFLIAKAVWKIGLKRFAAVGG